MKGIQWPSRAIRAALLVALPAMLSQPLQVMAEDEFQAIEAKIRTLAPDAPSIAVSETPIEGVLQVQLGNEIFYATRDAKYLIAGRIIDMDTKVNLTDQAKSGLRKELIDELDDSANISFAPESPEHELLVFTDIDCGYCRKLHSQIDQYMEQGIAISYLAYPRAGIGSSSYDKFVSVWCADDQQEALTLAKAGTDPEPMHCDNPISEQYDLGRAMGVTGTPALLTRDGTLIPGYVPPEQLRERLEVLATQVAQAE